VVEDSVVVGNPRAPNKAGGRVDSFYVKHINFTTVTVQAGTGTAAAGLDSLQLIDGGTSGGDLAGTLSGNKVWTGTQNFTNTATITSGTAPSTLSGGSYSYELTYTYAHGGATETNSNLVTCSLKNPDGTDFKTFKRTELGDNICDALMPFQSVVLKREILRLKEEIKKRDEIIEALKKELEKLRKNKNDKLSRVR